MCLFNLSWSKTAAVEDINYYNYPSHQKLNQLIIYSVGKNVIQGRKGKNEKEIPVNSI